MKLKSGYQLLLLLCVTLGLYYPTLFVPFNSLDDQLLVNQLLNQQGFSLARHFLPGGTYDYYRPLLTLTFEIDHHLGGLQEPFMHLVNVLVHALNVILLWLFARRFGTFVGHPAELPALLAALLFAVHPINTEAVNWIMGRTDLLAGTFVFVSLICLLRYVETRLLVWGAASALAVLLGALCKETALFLIPGACYLLFCRPVFGQSRWKLYGVMPLLYGLATVGYLALRWGAFQTDRGLAHTATLVTRAAGFAVPSGSAVNATPVEVFPWLDALRVAVKAAGFYAVKLFQPLPLNFAIHRIDPFYLLPGLALVAVLGFLAWQRRPLGWLFLVSASIGISALLVLFTQLAWTPVAERYMYIPCGPFLVGLVYLGSRWLTAWTLQRTALVVTPLLLASAAWATHERNYVWQDNLTLYRNTVRQSPDFAPARNQLAFALREHGREEEALAIWAELPVVDGSLSAVNRAAALWARGDYHGARQELQQRLKNPGVWEVRILEALISMTLARAGQLDDAAMQRNCYQDVLGWLQRMGEIAPSGFLHYRIGRVHLLLGNRTEAQRAFATAAAKLPADSLYREPAAKLARNLVP